MFRNHFSGLPRSAAIRSGTDYTSTVALLIVSLVFTPALLVFLHPASDGLLYSCIALMGITLFFANQIWLRSSILVVPSIAVDRRQDTE